MEETNLAALQHYDAVIIGAGQPGVPLARALAKWGRTTAVIEREHVGGSSLDVKTQTSQKRSPRSCAKKGSLCCSIRWRSGCGVTATRSSLT